MDLLLIATRVAAQFPQFAPSLERVRRSLRGGLNQLQRPFEEWNERAALQGKMTEPQIPDVKRKVYLDLGGGWGIVMRAIHDGDGDHVVVGWMNPGTKTIDMVWEGPPATLGLEEEDLDEAASAVHSAFTGS